MEELLGKYLADCLAQLKVKVEENEAGVIVNSVYPPVYKPTEPRGPELLGPDCK